MCYNPLGKKKMVLDWHFARHFVYHSCEAWRYTGSDDQTNIFFSETNPPPPPPVEIHLTYSSRLYTGHSTWGLVLFQISFANFQPSQQQRAIKQIRKFTSTHKTIDLKYEHCHSHRRRDQTFAAVRLCRPNSLYRVLLLHCWYDNLNVTNSRPYEINSQQNNDNSRQN